MLHGSASHARLLVVGGPTASGKSALAVELARTLGGEVVNADSQQVYRGLDIGTGKPTPQERDGIPHHLYDIAEPGAQMDAAAFARAADTAISDIMSRGAVPVVVGGTGLWIRALLKGIVDAPGRDDALRERLAREAGRDGWPALHARLARVDPDGAARIRPTDPVRIVRALEVFELSGVPLGDLHRRHALGAPRYPALRIALEMPRDELNRRIEARARAMFAAGLVEETQAAIRIPGTLPRVERTMGYREALALLKDESTLEEAIARTATEQRRYAKRQLTWLRAEPEWHWVRPPALGAVLALWREGSIPRES